MIHHCKIQFFSAKSWYDISPDVSLHSRVSPDVHEWRSVQLQEALPVPGWLHRAPLPVSTPASSGGARQQAAGLSHVSEARQPESWGAIQRGGSPDDANTLIFHTTPDTSRAPLLWRYLWFTALNARGSATAARIRVIHVVWTFSVLSADQLACSPHARHLCSHPASRPVGGQDSSQGRATPDPLQTQTEGALLPGDHTQASSECRHTTRQRGQRRRLFCSIDDCLSVSSCFSVTARRFLFWPIRRTAVAAWGILGDKTSAISAPNYQVSYMKIKKKNHICCEILSSLTFSWKVSFFKTFFKAVLFWNGFFSNPWKIFIRSSSWVFAWKKKLVFIKQKCLTFPAISACYPFKIMALVLKQSLCTSIKKQIKKNKSVNESWH